MSSAHKTTHAFLCNKPSHIHMQQKWTQSTSYFISQIINNMNTQGLRLNKTSNFLPQQRHLEVKLACLLSARPYSSVPTALIHKVQAILPHSVQMSTVRKANNMLILLWKQFWTYRPPEEGIPRDPRKYYLRTTSLSWPLENQHANYTLATSARVRWVSKLLHIQAK